MRVIPSFLYTVVIITKYLSLPKCYTISLKVLVEFLEDDVKAIMYEKEHDKQINQLDVVVTNTFTSKDRSIHAVPQKKTDSRWI